MRYFCWFLLALLAGGCTNGGVIHIKMSAWGMVLHLGQAEQRSAPQLWATSERLTAVWVGADANGIYHHSRTLTSSGLSSTTVLPLSPIHPYGQRLFAASGDNLHLLWLDANAEGETRLYAAVISPERTLVRGPILVSDQRTLRYAAVPDRNGALWVVFSGGLVAEPGLYAVYLDAEGRPRRDITRIISDADWPSFAQTNDSASLLFWRRPSDGTVQRARFADGSLDEATVITPIPLLPGDRLEDLSAAVDNSHEYVFWTVTRASGQTETWWASGLPDSGDWQAARLGIAADPYQLIETGFNTGLVFTALAGEKRVSWASPLAGQFDTLPVAAQSENALAMVYFRDGEIAGYQEIVQETKLIGVPDLKADRDQFLYVSWAQPGADGTADLWLASLKAGRIQQ